MAEVTQMDTGSPVSHENEDTYREKFENLKILVQQQQKELQSQKIRNEGVATITTCLQEEREENNHLRNKIQKLEQSVVTLQSRLSASGQNANLNAQEGESVLPGPSKQLMENLVRENTRLRQSLRQASGDPSHMEHLEKTIKSQQEQIDFLRKENARLGEELHKLKCEAAYPPEDNDAEVNRLRKELSHLQKSKVTQDVLCQSLSEESVNLRQRLKETADMCQHLARKLEDKDKQAVQTLKQPSPEESLQRISLTSQPSDSGLSEECAALRLHKSRAENEMSRLQRQLKAAETANAKWQVYDAQRNEQFQTLQNRLAETEGRLAASSGTPSFSEQQQQDIDRLLMQSKQKVEEAEQEKMKIEDENRSLRIRNKQLEDAIQTLQQQIQTMSATTSSASAGGLQRQEDKDHIRMLEAQVQIFTEDFEQERKDRERAQAKCAELEQELDLVKRQLEQFQVSHMSRLYNQRAAAMANYQNEYFNHRNIYSMMPQGGNLISRGLGVYEADGDGDDVNEEGEDCLDSGDVPPVAISVRDSVRGLGGSTSAHGSVVTDGSPSPSGIVNPPPLFGKNTTSTHADSSLFRGNTSRPSNNNAGSLSPSSTSSRSNARSPSGRQRADLSGDLFSDSGRIDTVDDTLQCPRCKKEYPTQNHMDFLDHVDKCCD